jgi:hypothetical protein
MGARITDGLKSSGCGCFLADRTDVCGREHPMKDLFEKYRDRKGTLVISFNDGTTITGEFVKQDQGFLLISGQVNAVGQICYVPFPNDNIKYMYWKDPDVSVQSPL